MSIINLEAISEAFLAKQGKLPHRVIICAGTGCVANGALKVFEEFKKQAEASSIPYVIELKKEDVEGKHVHISRSGCQGFCQMGPLVTIEPEGILYTKVKPGDVSEIVQKTLAAGRMVERLLYKDPRTGESYKGNDDIPFYKRQQRILYANNGRIDPTSIEDYVALGGYSALSKVLTGLSPDTVIDIVKRSG
ncbi:MAG TPA: NAD(P)H-dependent oxidoreductase subunit E, partial [Bacillota bacterium]|nr:NAD(P)H-dependent oxidoreductase subunit E [Bacillota bacterium]